MTFPSVRSPDAWPCQFSCCPFSCGHQRYGRCEQDSVRQRGMWRSHLCVTQWLRGRASDSRLRGPRFKFCAAVLKPSASVFTPHCSSSLRCINEYLAIDSGGYVYGQPSQINCSIWLDASQSSWDGVWLNRSVMEVKCKVRIGCCAI